MNRLYFEQAIFTFGFAIFVSRLNDLIQLFDYRRPRRPSAFSNM